VLRPGNNLCQPFGETVCDDEFDNDGDGIVDCTPVAFDFHSFPRQQEAAGQSHVWIVVDAPVVLPAEAIFECKTARDPELPAKAWTPCDGADGTIPAFGPIPEPDWEGKTRTLFRIHYADGNVSNVAALSYYLHASLNLAWGCNPGASDADLFDVADDRLDITGTFENLGNHLANPFIHINFTPPIEASFGVSEGNGPVEALSLRRRFVLNADRTMLLVTRNYESRRRSTTLNHYCTVGNRVHSSYLASIPGPPGETPDRTRNYLNHCGALVFNTAGAAACLEYTPGGVVFVLGTHRPYIRWTEDPYNGTGYIDFFMWRKMIPSPSAQVGTSGGHRGFFSPKCWEGGPDCAGGNSDILFLPDHDLFFE
jgi:hypothetical protein